MASLVDWTVAERAACKLAPAPPPVSIAEADEIVAELFRASVTAAEHVAQLTALCEPAVTAATLVVDRPGWIHANALSIATVMDPLTERLIARNPPGRLALGIGARATGAQAGAVLAFLSGKVLGQYEFFSVDRGQLLLVAPNIVAVERALRVDPSDFRLWVCLHEVTHRVQFTAVPWLREHLLGEVSALTETLDLDVQAVGERLRGGLVELVKIARHDGDASGLVAAFASPEAQLVTDRITGFMSLVEGHAEYVMNAVHESVIPSQQLIEKRFALRRRRSGNPFDRLLRSLLGLDAKTKQYTQGSQFVRQIVDRVGLDGFNVIWTSPDTLPTKSEIVRPQEWLSRVHR